MSDKLPSLSTLPDFIPLPDNLDEITFEYACRVFGGDPFGALSHVVQSVRLELAAESEVAHA